MTLMTIFPTQAVGRLKLASAEMAMPSFDGDEFSARSEYRPNMRHCTMPPHATAIRGLLRQKHTA